MKSKIANISSDKIKYGDEGIASQLAWLTIGVFGGLVFYVSVSGVLPIFPNIQGIISTYWIGFALGSFFLSILSVFILLGHEKVTVFDKTKYRIVQRFAGYFSVKRYLYKPNIWNFNEVRNVIVAEMDDENLYYSISLRLAKDKIVALSFGMYSCYNARKDAEIISMFIGLPFECIEEVTRKNGKRTLLN